MPDWIRKPTITAHPITATLRDANGPFGLPSGTTVMFRAKEPGAMTFLLSAPGTVAKPDAPVGDTQRGVVYYTLQTGDLMPGIYECDWSVQIPGLGLQIFPENGYQYLLVQEGADSV